MKRFVLIIIIFLLLSSMAIAEKGLVWPLAGQECREFESILHDNGYNVKVFGGVAVESPDFPGKTFVVVTCTDGKRISIILNGLIVTKIKRED